jgi:hypothetical protein
MEVNMKSGDILIRLRLIIQERLFGTGAWLAEDAAALHQMIQDMGLTENVPGESQQSRNTELGDALKIRLLSVFMGIWDELDVPMVLEREGLIESADEIYAIETDDPERWLKPIVQQAYLDFCSNLANRLYQLRPGQADPHFRSLALVFGVGFPAKMN